MERFNKSRWLITSLVSLILYACNTRFTAPTAILPPPSPTLTQPAPTPTPTLIPMTITPSLLPTRQPPFPLITPDPIQVERWKEYETALAKSVHPHLAPEEVLCEWDILGRAAESVYVWAVCRGEHSGGSVPAVIHLEADGSIRSVERAQNWSRDVPRLFPADVRGKFEYYHSGRAREMDEHIAWRRLHPEVPPLIILSATPAPEIS